MRLRPRGLLTCVNFFAERPSRGISPHMTQTVSRPDAGAPGGPPGVLAALLAGLFGWYTHEMLLASGGIGLAVAALLSFLVFRQRLERREAALALHNVEARVSGIVDSAMDAIIAVDERQRIVLFNAAAERVFRWPQGAVLGQPLGMLIPERLREAHGGHIARFGAT